MSVPRSPLKYWSQIDKIQNLLDLKDSEMAHFLDCDTQQYSNLRKSRSCVPAYQMWLMLERLDVSADLFFSQNLDYSLLKRKILNGSVELPKKYSSFAFGNIATPKAFIDSFIAKNSLLLISDLFRFLQISPSVLENQKTSVNVLFTLDIIRFLERSSEVNVFLADVGARGAMAMRPSEFDAALLKSKTYKDFYEIIPFLIETYIERNFLYTIYRINEFHAIYDVSHHKHIDQFSALDESYSHQLSLLCQCRISYLETLPKRIGLPKTKVKKLSCIHLNAPTCRYLIDFKPPLFL